MSRSNRCLTRLLVERLEDRYAPSVSMPSHLYTFDDGLNDAYSELSLVGDGDVSGGRYTFDAGEGLQLIDGLADTSTYSIAMELEVDSLGPVFKKMLDFQNQTDDNGLYMTFDRFQLYPNSFLSSATVEPNTDFQLVLTHDGATGTTSLYINGVLQATYTASDHDVATPLTNILTFFDDDNVTSPDEQVSGSADFIAVFDTVLTQAEISEIFAGLTSVAAAQSSVSADEGGTATNSGTWNDANYDFVTLTASVGDVTKNADGTWSWSWGTSDGPDDSQTVTITATTNNGSVFTTFDVVVSNLPPNVSPDNAEVSVQAGQTATNTGSWSDPGSDVVSLEASVGTVVKNDDGSWSWSFDTQSESDTQTVTITATDSDGAVTNTTFHLTVTNSPPVITSVTATDGGFSGNVSLSGAFTDTGVLDTHTVVVNWGDGSALETISVDQLNDTFAGNHHYATGGIFTITVTVSDNFGLSDVETASTSTVGVGLVDGTLYVIGSQYTDLIFIAASTSGGQTYYTVFGVFGLGGNTLKVHAQVFNAADVEHIVVLADLTMDKLLLKNVSVEGLAESVEPASLMQTTGKKR